MIKVDRKALLMPMIISIVMTAIQLYVVAKSNSPYKEKIILASVFIMLLWIVSFILGDREKKKIEIRLKNVIIIIMIMTLSFVIAICFSGFVWGMNVLSLHPINRINEGVQHKDTLFHSAIAESFGRTIIPSTLANAESAVSYHTFSHFLISIVGRIVSIPAFIAYNHIYPILFLPIYIFAQVTSIRSAKCYFLKSSQLNMTDNIIIGIYNIGILPYSILSGCGIWKKSYIGSESFLVGNTLAYFCYAGIFYYLQKDIKDKRLRDAFTILCIPGMIFFLSWAKISIGFLFAASIMYYIVRMYWRSARGWIIELLYGITFLISLYLFYGGNGTSEDIRSSLQLFAFMCYCDGIRGFLGHYIILSFMGILFVCFELGFNKYKFLDILNGKTVWIEEILIVCILGFLPGLIMDIGGGSAGYFSYAVETLSLILLCGHDYIQRLLKKYKKEWQRIVIVFLFWGCICTGILDIIPIAINSKMEMRDEYQGFYEELMGIREMTSGKQEEYTFYLDEDVKAGQVFQSPVASVYVYPALTGVGVINASYCEDGKYFTYDGTQVNGYGLDVVDNGRLSYDKALEKAKELGKKYLIHVFYNGYEIDELE